MDDGCWIERIEDRMEPKHLKHCRTYSEVSQEVLCAHNFWDFFFGLYILLPESFYSLGAKSIHLFPHFLVYNPCLQGLKYMILNQFNPKKNRSLSIWKLHFHHYSKLIHASALELHMSQNHCFLA